MQQRATRQLGPYHVPSVRMELDITFQSLLKFLIWLEASQQTNRIDNIRVKREADSLIVLMDVLGLVELKNAKKS